MRISAFEFDKYDLNDYCDYEAYFNYLIANKDRLVAYYWDSERQFGQIVLRK